MKKQWAVSVAIAVLAAVLGGCAQKSEAKKAEAAVQKPAVAVETAVAASGDLVEGIEVTGSLEPKFAADVKTQIPGLIRQVYVNEWLRVRKGTPLARIDIAETEALEKRAEAAI
ncbi:MAG TPA: efflux RND transporter periplasmic adaptor subunit, partial [Geobacteraceae bacterium]|nr:efflux RND transporter periplasmic adaptor subunit [Geobacteraceae bacterium]